MAPVCCTTEDDGPMSLGNCCPSSQAFSKKKQQKKRDDDTYLEVSSDSSNSKVIRNHKAADDDDASVVSAAFDALEGTLDLGADIGEKLVRSASEVLFGKCQQDMHILRDIEFDENSEASSFYSDGTDDAEDMTYTGSVRNRRSFGKRSTSRTATGRQVERPVKEEKETEISETSNSKGAGKYANVIDRNLSKYAKALKALKKKQAEALEEHHRLKEEENVVCPPPVPISPRKPSVAEEVLLEAPAPLSPRKPSVAEQLLLEADEEDFVVDLPGFSVDHSVDVPSDENDSTDTEEPVPFPSAGLDDKYIEPMIIRRIQSQSSAKAHGVSSINTLSSDFVPFWKEGKEDDPSTTTPSTNLEEFANPEEFASACLKMIEDNKEESKVPRKKKLSKIVPSFLKKRTKGKKKN